ncbi:hypothetical protein MAC_08003 [Metarhizium acridum CQMa 102]|uniref:Hemerythrin-like domain-containing protein n=1 Tax=Metarhizium acridum (strain CQMa 102) TaxID=655827 RepID=E9EDQ5_METAQ|nr:uncharacterized protein MAC_08003 [Metarhizium acridum CQMa 102]EFY85984.1 hypothetical protein MAC_08003 [Metarhizium acridum CQMa 102]
MAGDEAATSDVSAAETRALPPLSIMNSIHTTVWQIRWNNSYVSLTGKAAACHANFVSQHNYFRQTWTLLWTAATTSRRPQNLAQRQFLNEAISFARHLSAHHGIEEAHIFPLLATRMPEFDAKRGSLVKQHDQIHKGLEDFETYVKQCHAGREDFEMGVLREKMEGWEGVLWKHLDEEVKMLGAERMRAVWSKEEMMRMPM